VLAPIAITMMSQEDAEQIAGWRYEPPYDFYDADADHRDLAELLDPRKRGDPVYERAGFVRTRSFEHETNGGLFSFVEVERPA
jgi:hypothetical protein